MSDKTVGELKKISLDEILDDMIKNKISLEDILHGLRDRVAGK